MDVVPFMIPAVEPRKMYWIDQEHMSKYRKLVLLSIGIIVVPLVLIVHELIEENSHSRENIVGYIGLLVFGIFLLYHNLRRKKAEKNSKW
jgi:hypothetical protein